MTIAIVIDGQIDAVGEYNVLFPNTSFPEGGPSAEWLQENHCQTVITSLTYDPETQALVGVSPYLKDGEVLVVEVVDLTPDEIAERKAAKLLAKRQGMNVTPYQAKVVLMENNLLSSIDAVVEASSDPKIKLAWVNAIQFQRLSPLMLEMQKALEWDDLFLDKLFEDAANVV